MDETTYLNNLLNTFTIKNTLNNLNNNLTEIQDEIQLHTKLVSDDKNSGEENYINSLKVLKEKFATTNVNSLTDEDMQTLEQMANTISSILAVPGQEDKMTKNIIDNINNSTAEIDNFINQILPNYVKSEVPTLDIREVNTTTSEAETVWYEALRNNILDIYNDVYILKDIQKGIAIMKQTENTEW